MNLIHFFPLENLCENALDLSNRTLIIRNNWPLGTHCQWLISTEAKNFYTTLELEYLKVRLILGSLNNDVAQINTLCSVQGQK